MTWVEVTSAVATASAAVIALGFGVAAELRLHRDRRQRQALEERSQATRVAAWLDPEFLIPGSEKWSTEGFVFIQNASDEPIWHAMIDGPGPRGTWHIPIVPPNANLKRKADLSAVHDTSPLDVQFLDNHGRQWRRDRHGVLHREVGGRLEGRMAKLGEDDQVKSGGSA